MVALVKSSTLLNLQIILKLSSGVWKKPSYQNPYNAFVFLASKQKPKNEIFIKQQQLHNNPTTQRSQWK